VERLAGDPLHDLREHDRAEIRVHEAVAGRGHERCGVHEGEGGGAGPRLPVQRPPRREPRRMREQVPHGDALLVAPALELREVTPDGRVERQPSLIHELHAGGRQPHDLGERREVVQRAGIHRARVVGAVATHRCEQRDSPVAAHREHGSRKRSAVHLATQVVDDAGEARAVEPERGGRRRGNARARREGRTRAAGEEGAHERSETDPHGRASGMTTPAPMRYAGGRLIGSRPVIGTFPRSASATARSEPRTPLRAIRYDLTEGAWVRERTAMSLAASWKLLLPTTGMIESSGARRRSNSPSRCLTWSTRRTEASSRAAVIRPLATAAVRALAAESASAGIKSRSAPARKARTAASPAPYFDTMAPMSSASVTTRPRKPRESRNRPVKTAAERVAGSSGPVRS